MTTAASHTELVQERLIGLRDRLRPWPGVEQELASALPDSEVFLGGDGLRPYVLRADDELCQLWFTVADELLNPPLVAELLAGRFGLASTQTLSGRVGYLRLPVTAELRRRLQVPQVALIGLGDAERYRGARLALGIARLGQWLRFTHAARVNLLDYNLHEKPLQEVRRLLRTATPEIVGVSVNFGQWHLLHELAEVANEFPLKAVVLGNILAAYDPARAAQNFDALDHERILVATTLGERPMEALCRQIDAPEGWDRIAGFVRPRRTSAPATAPVIEIAPPELIFPDDGLVLGIVERGGQVSLETSFGCQFGACTFCPRDHRGEGWSRGQLAAVTGILSRLAPSGAVVSIIDEEFFGAEGLVDPPATETASQTIMEKCRQRGIRYEIYTRLEQIFDRRRSRSWNEQRARLLVREAETMRRIFVGVESGSDSQLRRYGKGQTVRQTVDSLRVGSSLGIPMEFGFITFDPLVTAGELAENIGFLARTDVIKRAAGQRLESRVEAVMAYLDQNSPLVDAGVPLYQHVAYMATELEVLAHSRYVDMLRRRYPNLLTGRYDASFARYETDYQDPRVAELAGWCRVWTDGMFAPVYQARMRTRAAAPGSDVQQSLGLVHRYRAATFALLLTATRNFVPETALALSHLAPDVEVNGDDPERWLADLSMQVLDRPKGIPFDLSFRGRHRDR